MECLEAIGTEHTENIRHEVHQRILPSDEHDDCLSCTGNDSVGSIHSKLTSEDECSMYDGERSIGVEDASISKNLNESLHYLNKKSVQFSSVHVRSYSRILGDNPSCSSGPSLSIGWDYKAEVKSSIDDYEISKNTRKSSMLVPRLEREVMLQSLGYSRSAIADAVRQNIKCKKQRRRTVHNLFFSGVEETTENIVKAVKNGFILNKQRKRDQALYLNPSQLHCQLMLNKSDTFENIQNIMVPTNYSDGSDESSLEPSSVIGDHNTEDTRSLTETDEGDRSIDVGVICINKDLIVQSTDSQHHQNKKSVQFSSVHVRSYSRILGDNPSCSSGPSLSIGWDYKAEVKSSIDDYEISKNTRKSSMLVPRLEREVMLQSLGYSRSAIADAVRQNIKCKKQRRRTVHNLFFSGVEETTENIVKAVKNCFSFERQRKRDQAPYFKPQKSSMIQSNFSEIKQQKAHI